MSISTDECRSAGPLQGLHGPGWKCAAALAAPVAEVIARDKQADLRERRPWIGSSRQETSFLRNTFL